MKSVFPFNYSDSGLYRLLFTVNQNVPMASRRQPRGHVWHQCAMAVQQNAVMAR